MISIKKSSDKILRKAEIVFHYLWLASAVIIIAIPLTKDMLFNEQPTNSDIMWAVFCMFLLLRDMLKEKQVAVTSKISINAADLYKEINKEQWWLKASEIRENKGLDGDTLK